MAAGVTGRLWSVEDLVALWKAYEQRRAETAAYMKVTVEVDQKMGEPGSLATLLCCDWSNRRSVTFAPIFLHLSGKGTFYFVPSFYFTVGTAGAKESRQHSR